MKTTVKNEDGRVHVTPMELSNRVLVSISSWTDYAALELTPDQCGALIVGLELAVEANNRKAIAAMRAEA